MEADDDGESICRSGIWPPWGRPSLMRASEISQVENVASFVGFEGVDIARSSLGSPRLTGMSRTRNLILLLCSCLSNPSKPNTYK
jgi:hypothetical protein